MFRRFSLFDAAPPSSTVSISRPKPPPIPKPQHSSASSASPSSSSLAANGCVPAALPIPELRVPPPRTNPINIAGGGGGGTGTTDSSPERIGSSNGSLNYLQPTPGHSPGSVGSNCSSTATAPNGGIKLLSSSPAYHHHRKQSIGSAPTHPTSVLQQQVHAAQIYLSSNRNSYVYGPPESSVFIKHLCISLTPPY
uniref:Uncharacterized protein n=1 Tax=Anopheles aquasalis TaxID=42839 RepID=T1E887_ANOAQ